MLRKTKGILLHQLQYSEKSRILKVYTREDGLQSFFLRSPGRKQGRGGALSPMALLEIDFFSDPNRDLGNIREFRPDYVFKKIGEDFYRNTVILFVNEVLYKSLRETGPQESFYDFLRQWLIHFDEGDFNPDAHLVLLAELIAHLGITPSTESYSDKAVFDMLEGAFTENTPAHSHFLEQPLAGGFHSLFTEGHQKYSYRNRRELLAALIQYISIHTEGFGNLNSREVLESVLK